MMMAAFSLTAVMGMSGLAVEIGTGYAAKVRNQRAADMAAVGAALAYRSSNQSVDAATQVARDIVVAHGLPANSATVQVPVTIGGASAVQVSVKTAVPIKMASLITKAAAYDVTSSAAASYGDTPSSGCVTALSSSKTAIDLSGGAQLTASGCTISTNGTLSATGGAQVSASQVVANATSTGGGANITTTPSANNIVTKTNGAADKVKSQSAVMTALCYVNKLNGTSDGDYADGNTNCANQKVTPVSVAAVTGEDWDMTSKPSSNVEKYRNGDNFVVPAGPYTIGTLTIDGKTQVSFVGPVTLTVDKIVVKGGTLTIGDGDVTVAGALTLGGGVTVTMGNGKHSFGSISIGGGSQLYTGTGSLNITADLNVDGGGSKAMFAPSTGQTVVIGDSKGTSISISGGSMVSFDRYGTSADTGGTQADGPVGFSVTGSIKSSGGSTIVFNKAAVHVIGGDLDLNGSSVLGSGLYVIGGDLSNNTGGTMSGRDVTFALGGSFTLAGGTSLDIAAPSSAGGYGIQDILVATKTTSDVALGGGTSDKYSGLVYAPKATLKLTGGAGLSSNGSQCLMVLVDSVSLSGGAQFNTNNCPSQANNAGASVALIQ